MHFPVQLIYRPKKLNADGTSTIYVQYCYSATQRTLLHTGTKIQPQYWDKKQRLISSALPRDQGDYDALNRELLRMQRMVEDLVTMANRAKVPNKCKFVKESFTPNLIPADVIQKMKDIELQENEQVEKERRLKEDLYFQFDDYIKSKARKVSKATLTVYQNVKSHLLAFEIFRNKAITFQSFDFSFYEDFVDYLTFDHIHMRRNEIQTGLRVNTIGKTIKQLRGFLKDRMKRKIIPFIDLTDYKVSEEESDAIYLTYDEIASIYHTPTPNHSHLAEYKDFFVLACLTGLRFSDFSVLKPEDLRKGMLYKKQEKSDNWVVIPLRQEAKDIFTAQFKEKIPQLTNAEFNKHIKRIGEIAGIKEVIQFSYKKGNKMIKVSKPKYQWITSHTARRSFCTNEFLAGTPVKLIMQISGHRKEKDFYKYIRITPEEAAKKVMELWEKRGDVKLFKHRIPHVVDL